MTQQGQVDDGVVGRPGQAEEQPGLGQRVADRRPPTAISRSQDSHAAAASSEQGISRRCSRARREQRPRQREGDARADVGLADGEPDELRGRQRPHHAEQPDRRQREAGDRHQVQQQPAQQQRHAPQPGPAPVRRRRRVQPAPRPRPAARTTSASSAQAGAEQHRELPRGVEQPRPRHRVAREVGDAGPEARQVRHGARRAEQRVGQGADPPRQAEQELRADRVRARSAARRRRRRAEAPARRARPRRAPPRRRRAAADGCAGRCAGGGAVAAATAGPPPAPPRPAPARRRRIARGSPPTALPACAAARRAGPRPAATPTAGRPRPPVRPAAGAARRRRPPRRLRRSAAARRPATSRREEPAEGTFGRQGAWVPEQPHPPPPGQGPRWRPRAFFRHCGRAGRRAKSSAWSRC